MTKIFISFLVGGILLTSRSTSSAQTEINLADLSITIWSPDGRYFAIKKKTELTLCGAGDFVFEVAVIKAQSPFNWGSEYAKFTDPFNPFRSYSSVVSFKSRQFSRKFTLPAGNYVLAVRNVKGSQVGSINVELDKIVAPKGYIKARTIYRKSEILTNAARKTYPFTISSDHCIVIDGCNRHCSFWIIDKTWEQAFLYGENYYYYTSFVGNTGGSPGRWIVKLPPGTYCLAASTGYDQMPFSFFIDEYRNIK